MDIYKDKDSKKIIAIKIIPILFFVSIFFGLFLYHPSTAHAAEEYAGKSENDFTKPGVHYLLRDESLFIYEKQGTDSPWPSGSTNEFVYNSALSGDEGGTGGHRGIVFVSKHDEDFLIIVKPTEPNAGKISHFIKMINKYDPDPVADFSDKHIYLQNYRAGDAIGTPDMPYYKRIFPSGTYNFDIVNINSDDPPFTRISPNSGREGERYAEYVFTLKKCNYRKGWSLEDIVYFYFVATSPDGHDRLAIRVDNEGNRSYLMLTGSTPFKNDYDVGGKWYAQGGYNEFLSKVFNGDDYSRTQRIMPESKHLDNDVLKKWGITCTVQESAGIDDALMGVAKLVNEALVNIIEGVKKYLDKLLIIGNLQQNKAIIGTWTTIRDISNSLLIIGLLLIALFNALRFQIEYYTAKALLPRLVVAAIFINFSLLLTQIILDLGNILTESLLDGAEFINIIPPDTLSATTTLGVVAAATVAAALFSGFILISTLIAFIMILVILVLRVVVIWILAILSPLVFLFSVLPFTRGLTSTWWNYLVKYVFMGTVIALFLKIAADLSKYGTDTEIVTDDFIKMLAIIILLIAAAVSPFVLGDKLAGAVTGKIGDWTKGMKKSRLARSRGGAALAVRRKAKEDSAFTRAQARRASGTLGYKARVADMLHKKSEREGKEGWASRKLRQRWGMTGGTDQKALEFRAEELQAAGGFDIMQKLAHSKPVTAKQVFDKKAATIGLISAAETERLAYTRQQQNENSLAPNDAKPHQIGSNGIHIPHFSDPAIIGAAIKSGAYHVIANNNIREGLMGKLGSSPEAIDKISNETIKFEQAGVLRKHIDGRTAVELLKHSERKKRKSLMGRFADLNENAQGAIEREITTNPELSEYRSYLPDGRNHQEPPTHNNPAPSISSYSPGASEPAPHNPHQGGGTERIENTAVVNGRNISHFQ